MFELNSNLMMTLVILQDLKFKCFSNYLIYSNERMLEKLDIQIHISYSNLKF
jgi:hypothetical protein